MAENKHKHKKKQGFRYFMQPPGNFLVFLDSLDKRACERRRSEREIERRRRDAAGSSEMENETWDRHGGKGGKGGEAARGLVCVHRKRRCG